MEQAKVETEVKAERALSELVSGSKTSDASLKGALGRWGRKVAEAAKITKSLAGNTWEHLTIAPSFADAAVGRIAHSAKVLAEGGYEKIFRQTFETVPKEELLNSFVVIPLYTSHYYETCPCQLRAANPSLPPNMFNSAARKYILLSPVDGEFVWFMGFLNHKGAVTFLQKIICKPMH